ncbi:MAG: hypothetical protein CME59_07690 [Halioglobus sp.]|nr:hypothetical protein [Halioglobus sp.]|tara:strand:+ start:3303 stop:3983 length:681 start_codon:yes stop_codon:yes gene_type:complete
MFTTILRQQFKFLVFQKVEIDLDRHLASYLTYIFIVSWIVGMGRYWDHPDAYFWQYAGLGSVIYIVVLSAFLYAVVLPLKPKRWSYSLVLIFVGLTSLPALLYAIPVERFMPLDQAQIVNAWFLGIVALWRVLLYVQFLFKGAGLGKFGTLIATLLPLSGIVVVLAILNLEHVMFDMMSGVRPGNESPNDIAYQVVFLLSMFAFMAFPITLICYMVEISRRKGDMT